MHTRSTGQRGPLSPSWGFDAILNWIALLRYQDCPVYPSKVRTALSGRHELGWSVLDDCSVRMMSKSQGIVPTAKQKNTHSLMMPRLMGGERAV